MSENIKWFTRDNLFASNEASNNWVKQCFALGCSNAVNKREGLVCKVLAPFQVISRFNGSGCKKAMVGGKEGTMATKFISELLL